VRGYPTDLPFFRSFHVTTGHGGYIVATGKSMVRMA